MRRLLAIGSLVLIGQIGIAQDLRPHNSVKLNDTELDRVTAGGISASLDNSGVVRFQGETSTPRGPVQGIGDMTFLNGSNAGTTNVGSLTLSGQAQKNLSSLLNIVSLNSNLSVNMNLAIVSNNSYVGQLIQSSPAPKRQ
jgi:hypothetical protein